MNRVIIKHAEIRLDFGQVPVGRSFYVVMDTPSAGRVADWTKSYTKMSPALGFNAINAGGLVESLPDDCEVAIRLDSGSELHFLTADEIAKRKEREDARKEGRRDSRGNWHGR